MKAIVALAVSLIVMAAILTVYEHSGLERACSFGRYIERSIRQLYHCNC